MPTQPAHPARARAALALALCALALLVVPAHAAAGSRTHAPAATGAGVSAVAAERVAEYWTPRRMGEARPLDLVLDRDGTATRDFPYAEGRPTVLLVESGRIARVAQPASGDELRQLLQPPSQP